MSAIISEALEKLHKVGETDKTLGESIVDIIRKLNEAEMSDEEKADVEILKRIYSKTQNRANAKLTPEEKAVLDKYGLDRNTYSKDIEKNYRSIRPAVHSKDWRGRPVKRQDTMGSDSKVDYINKIKTMDDRTERKRYGRNYIDDFRYGTFQDKQRQAYDNMLRNNSKIDTMRWLLRDRKDSQKVLDTIDADTQKRLDDLDRKRQEIISDRDERKTRHADNIKNTQTRIDKLLKRDKTESLGRVRRRGLKESNDNAIPTEDFKQEVLDILKLSTSKDYALKLINNDDFIKDIKDDVEETSGWEDEREYNEDDIRLAVGRVLVSRLGLREALRRNSKRGLVEDVDFFDDVDSDPVSYAEGIADQLFEFLDWAARHSKEKGFLEYFENSDLDNMRECMDALLYFVNRYEE